MAKAKPDESTACEALIEQRLGERKYRQLRMHLNAALRLLGELAATNEGTDSASASQAPEGKSSTMTAMTTLAWRLRALPHERRDIAMRDIPRVKRKQPRKPR